ncbi:MAG: presenilin family intramembrane aspartyl protease PSH [Candidatus Syntropharchaeales archaeon]
MGLFILIVQIAAVILAPDFESAGIVAFENPESVTNPIIYIIFILVFTLFLLFVMRREHKWMIKLVMYGAVFGTLFYVFILPFSAVVALISAFGLTLLIYIYPEWYVIDGVGLIIAAGATSIFGVSLAVIPVIVLLIILAIYDAISVYRTRHMVTLAEGVLDLKLPILFILPRRKGFSFLKNTELKGGNAFIMGLGDAIIPSILVVSANFYLEEMPMIWILNYPALGAIIGTIVGYVALSTFVGKGKPHAGLPFLNTGAILGFLVGLGSALYLV